MLVFSEVCDEILLMEEILHQLRLVVYPIIYMVLYIPGGAGFLPSTVSIPQGSNLGCVWFLLPSNLGGLPLKKWHERAFEVFYTCIGTFGVDES